MNSPLRRVLLSSGASLSFFSLALGCAPAQEPGAGAPAEEVAVEVLLDEDRKADLPGELRLRSAHAVRANQPDADSEIRFEFTPDKGDVTVGSVPDPRFLRSEEKVAGAMVREDLETKVGALQVRLPNVNGSLRLYNQHGLIIGSGTHSAVPKGQLQQPLASDEDVGELVKVVDSGSDGPGVRLMFLPEGYTGAELPQFHAKVDEFVEKLRSDEILGANWSMMNVWRRDIASRQSGIDDPSTGTQVDTAFDVSFGETIRRCAWPKTSAAMSFAGRQGAAVNSDQVIVLVNNPTGENMGCAGSGLIVDDSPDSIVHELGHGLFKVRDEYSTSATTNCRTGKNVSLSSDPSQLPWSDLVNTSTFPTTQHDSSLIGAYEGAGHCASGAFRPQHRCKMKSRNDPFCAVCRREAARYFSAKRGECAVETLGGIRYAFCNQPKSFTEAAAQCEQLEGSLTDIRSEQDNHFIYHATRGYSQISGWWIGLSDQQPGGGFRWLDGSEPAFSTWANEPPAQHYPENCGSVGGNSPTWRTSNCQAKFPFVCRLPPEKFEPWAGMNESGSVATDEEAHFATPTLPPGRYKFTLSGTGDADLYVRIGGPASTAAHDCRTFDDGLDESCSVQLDTPAEVHAMVHGWVWISQFTLVGAPE